MHYGVTLNFCSAKVCLAAIFETCSLIVIWFTATDYCPVDTMDYA